MKNTPKSMVEDIYGPTIHIYTRKQAIEDGDLVDVSKLAEEAGFKIPVAVSRAVWADCIVPSEIDRSSGQSEDGRLWDLLFMLRVEIRKGGNGSTVYFKVAFLQQRKLKVSLLVATIGPGDDAEPVITVMKPGES